MFKERIQLSPGPQGSSPTSGTGLQVVFVTSVLQVMRGTFFDPVVNALAPLPPHRWHVEHRRDPSKSFLGSLSNKQGFSKLLNTPGFHATPDTEQCTISLRPEVPAAELNAYRTQGEIWLNRDARSWVVLGDVARFTTRRLIRLPLWNSKRKFGTGGLSEGPTEFMVDGVTTFAGLIAHAMMSPRSRSAAMCLL